jgi:hypothetical protein
MLGAEPIKTAPPLGVTIVSNKGTGAAPAKVTDPTAGTTTVPTIIDGADAPPQTDSPQPP